MRTSVNVDALILLGIHLLYWLLDTVAASGGALDSTPAFQTGASSTSSSHSKIAAFSATLTDGLAQAVAHESSKLPFSIRFRSAGPRATLAPPIRIMCERVNLSSSYGYL
jgi:hypothetical protein